MTDLGYAVSKDNSTKYHSLIVQKGVLENTRMTLAPAMAVFLGAAFLSTAINRLYATVGLLGLATYSVAGNTYKARKELSRLNNKLSHLEQTLVE